MKKSGQPIRIFLPALLIVCLSASYGQDQAPAEDARAKALFARDHQILETVLKDFSKNKGEAGAPLSMTLEAPRDVYFNPQPMESAGSMGALTGNKDVWKTIGPEDRAAIASAVKQLAKRTDAKAVFETFKPRFQRLRIVKEIPKLRAEVPYEARYPLQASVPGYSADGSVAVVELFFPERLHHSDGIIVLYPDEGQWHVLYRSFITYL